MENLIVAQHEIWYILKKMCRKSEIYSEGKKCTHTKEDKTKVNQNYIWSKETWDVKEQKQDEKSNILEK